jgi:ABC-type transport system substrate-binding protein
VGCLTSDVLAHNCNRASHFGIYSHFTEVTSPRKFMGYTMRTLLAQLIVPMGFRSRVPARYFAGFMILVGIFLVGCGSPETHLPSSTPSPIASIFQIAEVTTPPPSGNLRVAVVGTTFHRDLHKVLSEWGTLFGPGLAYSRLFRFKHGPSVQFPSMEVECDLCESWRIVDPDSLIYEFRLRADARWQRMPDSEMRSMVTADDVMSSLNRLRTSEWPHAGTFTSIKAMEASADNRTFTVTLHYPDPELLQKLANPHAVIMVPELLQGLSAGEFPVVGSGPWEWYQGISGETHLSAVDGYHPPGFPRVSKLTFVPVPDLMSGSVALGVGSVDIAQVDEDIWPQLDAKGLETKLIPRQGLGQVLVINNKREKLSQVEVRRKLFASIDPFTACDEMWDALCNVGVGVPVVEPNWLPSGEELRRHFYQADKVVHDLPEAQAIVLTIANYGPSYVAYGQYIGEQLSDGGFEVTMEVVSRSEYLDKVWQRKEFDVSLGPLPPVNTTNDFLFPLLHSKGQWHITGHGDEELDRLIELQSMEMDEVERGNLVKEIQLRVLDQALLFMPVITIERWAFNDRVNDWYPNMQSGDGSFWQSVSLDPSP